MSAAVVDIYCRVSTDPQEDNTSLDEQEQCARQFCADNGLVVGMVHKEIFTGYQYRERKKLTLMRERYHESKIQGVEEFLLRAGFVRCSKCGYICGKVEELADHVTLIEQAIALATQDRS